MINLHLYLSLTNHAHFLISIASVELTYPTTIFTTKSIPITHTQKY